MQYAILISAPKNTYTIFLHTSMLTHQTAPPHTQDTVHYQWRGGSLAASGTDATRPQLWLREIERRART